jgi:tetratricopeptide (TPR) repeat protein
MPSHIFLQLGQWQDVVNSNIDAYAAAVAGINKHGLAEGREDFHTLSWLAYANLMLGKFEVASDNLKLAEATLTRNPDSARVHNGYLNMRGRHILETGQWTDLGLDDTTTIEGKNANWVSVVGMSAAHRGNQRLAKDAIQRLAELADAARSGGNEYGAREIAILEKETMAVLSMTSGDKERAVALAREAAQMEMRDMSAPSGPPVPMKPAVELYADILLEAGQAGEAVKAYEQSLQWIPMRTPSIAGYAKAAAKAGDKAGADAMWKRLNDMPGIDSSRTMTR